MVDYTLWIVIVLGIFFHELGHWIYLLHVTKKIPKINLEWYGITVGDYKVIKNLNISQYIIMMLAGIIAGLPFFIWHGSELFLAYLLLSSFDFAMIIGISQAKKEYKLKWTTLIKDIPCERCIKIKKK